MPAVKQIQVPETAELGVAIEGSEKWCPSERSEAVLPEFDKFNQQAYYIEVFNRGQTPFEYSIMRGKSWIKVSKPKGKIETGERLWVSIDWKNYPLVSIAFLSPFVVQIKVASR